MLLTTIESISGKQYETIGLVKGNNVQTVNMFRDMGAGFKSLVGGELKKYNEMMARSREIATERMVEEATAMGANAIIGVKYNTSSIMQGAAEVMVYGTAVKIVG